MSSIEELENRRQQFAKELSDIDRFPRIITYEHAHSNGTSTAVESNCWDRARFFFLIPVEENLQDFRADELYLIQNVFRADGGSRLYSAMTHHFMNTSGDSFKTLKMYEDASFYNMKWESYADFVVKRALIGFFAEIESYPGKSWEYISGYAVGLGDGSRTMCYGERKALGASRDMDPMNLLKKIRNSNYVTTDQEKMFRQQLGSNAGVRQLLHGLGVPIASITADDDVFMEPHDIRKADRKDMPSKLPRNHEDEECRIPSPGDESSEHEEDELSDVDLLGDTGETYQYSAKEFAE